MTDNGGGRYTLWVDMLNDTRKLTKERIKRRASLGVSCGCYNCWSCAALVVQRQRGGSLTVLGGGAP